MVSARGKVRNLQRDPRCLLVMFEVSPPFRGGEARGNAIIEPGPRTSEARRGIASRYLGDEAGERFTHARADVPSVIVRVPTANAKTWNLSAIATD